MKLRDSNELRSPVGRERKGARNSKNKIRYLFFCYQINLFVSSKEHLILMKLQFSTELYRVLVICTCLNFGVVLVDSLYSRCLDIFVYILKLYHFYFIHSWFVRAWVFLSPVQWTLLFKLCWKAASEMQISYLNWKKLRVRDRKITH